MRSSDDIFQRLELNATGFSILSREQLRTLYGSSSPYHDPATLHRLSVMSRSEMEEALVDDIERISQSDSFHVKRQRDSLILSPVSFQLVSNLVSTGDSTILSPFFFSPLIQSKCGSGENGVVSCY